MSEVEQDLKAKIANVVRNQVANPSVNADPSSAYPISQAVSSAVIPDILHATNNEPIWQSRVMIGSIATIVTSLFGIYALYSASVTDGELYAAPISAILGAGFAIYGRTIAKRPIGE